MLIAYLPMSTRPYRWAVSFFDSITMVTVQNSETENEIKRTTVMLVSRSRYAQALLWRQRSDQSDLPVKKRELLKPTKEEPDTMQTLPLTVE